MLSAIVCPDCGFQNRAGVLLCENCGADLYDSLLEKVTTKQLDRTESRAMLGEMPQGRMFPLVFYISHEDSPIAIERGDDLILGRYDNDNPQIKVHLDLDLYGAQEKGVSRQHLTIRSGTNPPLALDLGSHNGTYINGQKLVPNQPHPLMSGDEIRLGKLTLRLYYK